MNAAAYQSYHQAIKETETPRSIEYRIISRVTQNLEKQKDSETISPDMVSALHDNRIVWQALAADMVTGENKLPQPVQVSILSLSVWVDKHTTKILRGEGKIVPLIDVNRSIMKGLAAKPSREAV